VIPGVALVRGFATVVIVSTLPGKKGSAAHTMADGNSMPGGTMP